MASTGLALPTSTGLALLDQHRGWPCLTSTGAGPATHLGAER